MNKQTIYFYLSEMNQNFKNIESDYYEFIDWTNDSKYTFMRINSNKVKILNISNKEFLDIEFLDDYSDYVNTILGKYIIDCIDNQEIIEFNAINYAKESDIESVKSYLNSVDSYEKFNDYPKDRFEDELTEYYLRSEEDNGRLTNRRLKEITEEAYDKDFINEEQKDTIIELIQSKDEKEIYIEGINSYTKVSHQDDPNLGSNSNMLNLGYILNLDEYEYEDQLDKGIFDGDNCEYWVPYSDDTGDIDQFDELIKMYSENNKKDRYYNIYVNYYFRVKVYITKEGFDNIIKDFDLSKLNINKTKLLLSDEKNTFVNKEIKSFEKKIQYINSPHLYRVAMILGKEFSYDINNEISIPEYRELINKNSDLSLFTDSKDVVQFINNNPDGFSIKDMITSKIIPSYSRGSLFKYLSKDKGIKESDYLQISITDNWKSDLQRVFQNNPNYVFQLNFNKKYLQDVYEGLNIPEENRRNINNFKSIHPIVNDDKYVSLAYIRYTVTPEYKGKEIQGVILDEIQSDFDKKQRFGMKVLKGWEDIILKKFISYVRKNLGYDKIYMPTMELKNTPTYNGGYGANVPEFTAKKLYLDLPKEYGFKQSNLKDFLLLERVKKRFT